MLDLNKIYLFRMTHLKNVSHIVGHGITHRNSINANPNYEPIGDNSLISTRSTKKLPNGTLLGEYIPFYFAFRTPMLYVIQKGFNGNKVTNREEIVYCITSVQQVLDHNLDFIFSNGHAVDNLSDFFNKSDIESINNIIDFDAVKTKNWRSDYDTDLKRRKEAEFLVKDDLPKTSILGYVVYNETAKSELIRLNIDENKVIIRENYYF